MATVDFPCSYRTWQAWHVSVPCSAIKPSSEGFTCHVHCMRSFHLWHNYDVLLVEFVMWKSCIYSECSCTKLAQWDMQVALLECVLSSHCIPWHWITSTHNNTVLFPCCFGMLVIHCKCQHLLLVLYMKHCAACQPVQCEAHTKTEHQLIAIMLESCSVCV